MPDAEFGDPRLAAIQSRSTLRFRTQAELEASLTAAGFVVEEVRDAPDRTGRELVFLARRADASS